MTVSFLLQIAGLLVEIAGAAFLGRSFVSRIHFWRMPSILISSLLGTGAATAYSRIAPDGQERTDRVDAVLDALRGTALLWTGFVLQLAGVIVQWASSAP